MAEVRWNRSINSTGFDGVNPLVQELGLAYRPPTYKWTIAYPEWKDDASCNGRDENLWVLQDADEITKDDQHELIAQGLRICAACPVRQACLDDSNDIDRYWSTRGGQPPEGLFPDSKRPPYENHVGVAGGVSPHKGRKLEPIKKCKRNHDEWIIRKDGSRQCAPCIKLRNAARAKGKTMD